MIYLTYAKTQKKSAEELADMLNRSVFTDEYVNAILERKSPRSVNESLCALLLLQKTLDVAGIDTEGYRICRGENGRPYFEGAEGLDFSITHSDNAVAVALSTDGRVGLDVEKAGAVKDTKRLAARFFSESENKALENVNDYEKKWTCLWTRKEAYIKYSEKRFASLKDADTENTEGVSFYTQNLTFNGEEGNADKYFLTLCAENGEHVGIAARELNLTDD